MPLRVPFKRNSGLVSVLSQKGEIFSSGLNFAKVYPFECNKCALSFKVDIESEQSNFSYPIYELLAADFKKFLNYSLGQNNGYLSYGLLASASLSIEGNETNSKFNRFVQKQCLAEFPVLDIGCGPQELPIYLRGILNKLIGLDPFSSRFQGTFIQGTAEYIPIPSSTVGSVVCATSIDHLFDLEMALDEIKRVLVTGGRLILWDHAAYRRTLSINSRFNQLRLILTGKRRVTLFKKKYQIYDNGVVLPIPRGFSDPFHTPVTRKKNWSVILRKKLLAAGFREVLEVDENGFSCWETA